VSEQKPVFGQLDKGGDARKVARVQAADRQLFVQTPINA